MPANRVLAIVLIVGGLATLGWGAQHFDEAPLPARKNGFGYIQYETSAQLRAIFGGLTAVGVGITVWRRRTTRTGRKRR